MTIVDIFDAIRDGTYEDFRRFYKGDVNQTSATLDLNLLSMAVVNNKNPSEKLKIMKFLISEKIDINYITKKEKRNALHLFYFCVWRPTVEYEIEVTKLLVENNININALDKYQAIPLKYTITLNKLSTQENKKLYCYLLENGSNYRLKDVFGKSCLDYATEYSWREEFIDIVKGYENGKNR